MTDDMPDTPTLPLHWVDDQARAWRLAAAIWDHDANLFTRVVGETRTAGDGAVDGLLAALARNLVIRLRMAIGPDALDELIVAELEACAAEPLRQFPFTPPTHSDDGDDQ